MFRNNPLMRNVLITTDEVIFHAPTKQTLDSRTIQNSIIIAEERLIRPALGNEMYEALLEEKNREVTAGNKPGLETQVNAGLPSGSGTVTLSEGQLINAFEFLSADNLALWKQHLWKLTAECVMLLAVPEGFVQFGSEGVIHTAPVASPLNTTGVSTPELKSVRWAMDKKMMDRIDPLMEAMHSWLCTRKKANRSIYPLYDKDCGCDHNGVPYKKRSDLVLGLYDDDDDDKCGCR